MEAQTPPGVKWTLGVCGEQPQRLGSLQGAAGRAAALLGAGMEGLGVPSLWGAPRGPAAGTARDGDASSRCSKLGHICCLCMGLVGLLMKSGGGVWAENDSESSEGGVLQLGHLGALGQQRSGNWDCRDLGALGQRESAATAPRGLRRGTGHPVPGRGRGGDVTWLEPWRGGSKEHFPGSTSQPRSHQPPPPPPHELTCN